jgi:hypothetical protein
MVYRSKSLVGYSVRRPLTLWGRDRTVGEFITLEEVASLARVDSMVRSGRLNQVFFEDGQKVERSRGGAKIRVFDSQDAVPEVVAEPEVADTEEPVQVKTPAKRAAKKAV